MAYYYELVFDRGRFMVDYGAELEKAHKHAVEQAFNKAKSAGYSDVWVNPYILDVSNTLSEIVTDSVKAFINLYGSGSQMVDEDENPYLSSYINSEYYNKARGADRSVHYRSEERYKTLDWVNDSRSIIERKGSGKEGVYEGFKETKPSLYKMQDILKEYRNTFLDYYEKETAHWISENIGQYFTSVKVNV